MIAYAAFQVLHEILTSSSLTTKNKYDCSVSWFFYVWVKQTKARFFSVWKTSILQLSAISQWTTLCSALSPVLRSWRCHWGPQGMTAMIPGENRQPVDWTLWRSAGLPSNRSLESGSPGNKSSFGCLVGWLVGWLIGYWYTYNLLCFWQLLACLRTDIPCLHFQIRHAYSYGIN